MNSEFEIASLAYYLMPVLLVSSYALYRGQVHKRNRLVLERARSAGLAEPVSLHPIFDEVKCLGCKACVSACPEKDKQVIGIVANKAQLVNPSHCIGHGACKKACPFDAITLVFGSEKRGVDIPMVSENFETNIPGIFIAGELGGMGLIRNAVEQGKQALAAIKQSLRKNQPDDVHDVIIVGAGPAGFSASLAAQESKLKYLTLEQDSLGGTVFNFPRGKVVMTQPANLPMVGKIKVRETSKEALLSIWQDIEQRTRVQIQYRQKVDAIERAEHGFTVTTPGGQYKTQTILLAIGRRGTPRKLGVSGEELPKVVYRLIDPEQYIGHKVLIVGGGDSALEAALSIAEQPDTRVALSYRSASFSRAKEKNRQRIEQASASGQIQVLYSSNVTHIDERTVSLSTESGDLTLDNDAVIINAGGILPTAFLKDIGIEVETKFGTA